MGTEGKLRGRVSITEQVIASIAGLAAAGVEGVSGLRGNVAENLKAILGDESSRRGVLTRLEADGSVHITLHVAVEYGYPIHEVARKLQEQVKRAVEGMTGLRVQAVDVYVSDLTLPEGTWEAPEAEQSAEPAEVGEPYDEAL
jgi:uncharacterized alkaline shock family protein YloU